MKKVTLSILILFLSSLFIYAQSNKDGITYEESQQMEQTNITTDSQVIEDEDPNTSLTSNDYFDLELIKNTQSPFNKKISFTIKITPKIDSPKTQIIWSTPSVFTVEKEHPDFVSLSKGETYSYSAKLKPNKEGTYSLSVNVVSWQYNSNKSASVDYNMTINKSLVLQPVDSMFIITLILFILGVIGGSALVIYILVKATKKLVIKAKVWLTPPI